MSKRSKGYKVAGKAATHPRAGCPSTLATLLSQYGGKAVGEGGRGPARGTHGPAQGKIGKDGEQGKQGSAGSRKQRWVAVNEDGRRIGETHPSATLTDHDIDLMFALRDSGMTVVLIARKFEITREHASRVLNCKKRNQTPTGWRDLDH